MKCRLSQPPLSSMNLAFACQQTFAKETLGTLQTLPLHEAMLVCDQYVSNIVGMVYEVGVVPTESESNDISILPSQTVEIGQRISPQRQQCRRGNELPSAQFAGAIHPAVVPLRGTGRPIQSTHRANSAALLLRSQR
jgi:hypothetical protein